MRRLTVTGVLLVILLLPPSVLFADDYVVGPGDTLGAIAENLNTTPERLAELNGLSDPNKLAAGQVLKVDGRPKPAAAVTPARPTSRVIEAGDSLSSIAAQAGVTTQQLAEWNGIKDVDRLQVSQTLRLVPPAASALAPAPSAAPQASSKPGPAAAAPAAAPASAPAPVSGMGGRYVVQSGDTLSGIAYRLGVPSQRLAGANGLQDLDRLAVGQDLLVPAEAIGTAARPAAAPTAQAAPPAAVAAEKMGGRYAVQSGDTLSGIALRVGVSTERLAAANALADLDRLAVGQDLFVPAEAASGGSGSGPAAAKPAAAPTSAPTSPPAANVPSTTATPTPAPREKPVRYSVQPGDTLAGLAQRLDTTADRLATLNKLDDPNRLAIGQELVLPAEPKPAATAAPSPTPSATMPPTKTPTPAPPAPAPASATSAPPATPTPSPAPAPKNTPTPAPTAPPATEQYVVQPGDFLAGIARKLGLTVERILALNPLQDPNRLAVGQVLIVPTPTPSGVRVVEVSRRLIGRPYRWGGHTPEAGFDCTGFTWYVYRQLGISLSQHDLVAQMAAGRTVGWEELAPGDLLFFENTYQPGLSHVGIYADGNRFVHARDESSGVIESPLLDPYWTSRRVGARRIF